jgi:hypothetical protein
MTTVSWMIFAAMLILFWGVAIWSLARTLARQRRKLALRRQAARFGFYGPRARRDLEEWLITHSYDPDAALARERLEQDSR